MSDTFPCTSCGLCCKHIAGISELEMFDRGDGVCRNLIENRCVIYINRPLICRVDEMYEHMFSHMEKKQFYNDNLKVCKSLQEQAGLPPEKHVNSPYEPI